MILGFAKSAQKLNLIRQPLVWRRHDETPKREHVKVQKAAAQPSFSVLKVRSIFSNTETHPLLDNG
jgi:hypothetical protein